MIRTVSLGLLLLVTHHARGFSRGAAVVHHHAQGIRSGLALLERQLSASNAWNPVFNGEDVWTSTSSSSAADDDEAELITKKEYDSNLFVLAAIPPILAFISYGEIAHAVAYIFDLLGFRGSNVDGNAFATNLLRPTINGVVGRYILQYAILNCCLRVPWAQIVTSRLFSLCTLLSLVFHNRNYLQSLRLELDWVLCSQQL